MRGKDSDTTYNYKLPKESWCDVVSIQASQTLYNKALDSSTITLSTNILRLKNGNNTISLTLPAAADAYMCDLTSSQTLSNKTLTNPLLSLNNTGDNKFLVLRGKDANDNVYNYE